MDGTHNGKAWRESASLLDLTGGWAKWRTLKVITLLVSQPPMFWLKTLAPENMPCKSDAMHTPHERIFRPRTDTSI